MKSADELAEDFLYPWAVIWNTGRQKGLTVKIETEPEGFTCYAIFRTKAEAEEYSKNVPEWDLVPIQLMAAGRPRPTRKTGQPSPVVFDEWDLGPTWIN